MVDVQIVDDSNFKKEVLESSIPVIVDFFAEWCPPCKMYGPAFEKTSAKFAGRVKFVKVDVDSAGETAAGFGVMSIPTTILFKDGKPAANFVGAMDEARLESWINGKI